MTRADLTARFPRASEAFLAANCGPQGPCAAPGVTTPAPRPPKPATASTDAPAPKPAAKCPTCGKPGVFIRRRYFETEDAAVWECQQPTCSHRGLLWHTSLSKQASQSAKRPRAARVPRTRNGGTWTEAQFWKAVRSSFRRAFRFWKPALAALKSARVMKRGPHGQKWAYLCADCGKLYLRREVQIDHVEPVGALTSYDHLPDFLRRLTPETTAAFAIRCKACHQAKTNAEKVKGAPAVNP